MRKKKNALSTSLRSEIQATDSTRSGCKAKKAATIALRQSRRHSPQDEEQEQRVGDMESQADEVVSAGIQPEELAVQDVG